MKLFAADSNGCVHDRWGKVLLSPDAMRIIPGGPGGPIGEPIRVLDICWGCGLLRASAVDVPPYIFGMTEVARA